MIEVGTIRPECYDGIGAVITSANSFGERYDPKRGFVVTYFDGEEMQTAAFNGLENFEFEPYIPSQVS